MGRIFCIIDGMTDPEFSLTEYPNMAGMKVCGYVDTCHGAPPESLGCILRLLGVRNVPPYLRGYAEALGAGIKVEPQDLVLRGSWFSLDAAGRCASPMEAPQDIPQLPGCRYYPLEQYKSLLMFPGLASKIQSLTTYPPYLCHGQAADALCPKGLPEVEKVFALLQSEKRCLIPWGQSVSSEFPPFPEKARVVCGTGTVRGIAKLLKMEIVTVAGATGDVDTDLEAKTEAALTEVGECPFVLLHINGADEAAHRKNPREKKEFLQKIDRTVIPRLLSSEHGVYVIADHGTDPKTGRHLDMRQIMLCKE